MAEGHKQPEQSDSRPDYELIIQVESEVGDVVRIWRTKFDDPNPVRVEVITEMGDQAEAWLSDNDSTTVSRAMEVIR